MKSNTQNFRFGTFFVLSEYNYVEFAQVDARVPDNGMGPEDGICANTVSMRHRWYPMEKEKEEKG